MAERSQALVYMSWRANSWFESCWKHIFLLNIWLPARFELLNGAHANEIKHDHSSVVIIILDWYDKSYKALHTYSRSKDLKRYCGHILFIGRVWLIVSVVSHNNYNMWLVMLDLICFGSCWTVKNGTGAKNSKWIYVSSGIPADTWHSHCVPSAPVRDV